MPIDKTKFIAQFKAETLDHLNRLSDGLLALEKNGHDTSLLNELMREAHTIKGSARMMGYDSIADIAHRMEDGFETAFQQHRDMTPDRFDVLLEALDTIESLCEGQTIRKAKSIEPDHIQALCRRIEMSLGQGGVEHEEPDTSATANPETEAPTDPTTTPMEPAKDDPSASSWAVPTDNTGKHRRSESIRTDVEKIDKLANLAGEMLTARTRLNELLSKASSRVGASDEINRMYADTVQPLVEVGDHIKFISSDMQDEILGLRMIPLANLFDAFSRTIRDLAREYNKDIVLKVQGEETCLDKMIVEEMKAPLMHLVRNAVDHGLESPEERIRRNKPETGTISLNAYPSGSQVTIEVSDDGRGIEVQRIKQKALGLGLIDQRQAQTMTDEQAFEFLFHSGFTTKDTVTDLSGRGFGLDVVAQTISQLKGLIAVESETGKGTRFTIKLPLTVSIAENLLVHCGSDVFAIPIDTISETVRIRLDQIETVGRRETVTIRDRVIPLIRIHTLFSLPRRGIFEKRFYPVIVVQSVGSHIALLVDDIVGHQEVVIKPLGYPLRRVHNIAGATVLGNGSVALILDIPSIVKALSDSSLYRQAVKQTSVDLSANKTRQILLAEDTLTTAMLEKDVLESAGFNVTHALDGQAAWDMAQNEHFDLIITDVLMPRMDGFALTKHLKKDSRFSDIPVMIVTTRESDEDVRKGMEAGADAYILKKDFTSNTLLETIDRLIH